MTQHKKNSKPDVVLGVLVFLAAVFLGFAALFGGRIESPVGWLLLFIIVFLGCLFIFIKLVLRPFLEYKADKTLVEDEDTGIPMGHHD